MDLVRREKGKSIFYLIQPKAKTVLFCGSKRLFPCQLAGNRVFFVAHPNNAKGRFTASW
jgi:hypothetical protein